MGDEEIYGVVEMINKKGGGAFTNSDQDHFQTFSVFCALALRYAKVSYCTLSKIAKESANLQIFLFCFRQSSLLSNNFRVLSIQHEANNLL